MGFAENLKQIRKDRQLSQEELAERLNVSRQAVSKWEQGVGYPEVETLLLLSKTLTISLDVLMETGFREEPALPRSDFTGSITITSPHENVIATCYKVLSSGKIPGGKGSPRYFLFGVSRGALSFWEEPTTFLGWYKDQEKLSMEISEIQNAIQSGIPTYTLKYSAKTQRKWGRIRLTEE